ncbi:MAG: hypothetical protein EON93_01085 [Burkholderiales bacterium]|nr:MAG: hypothetical protein EON93_01085 [Burkholderiales bacterium]
MSLDIVYIDDEPQPLLAAARAVRAGTRVAEFAPVDWNVDEVLAIDANLWVLDFFNAPLDEDQDARDHAGSNGMTAFQKLRFLAGDYRPPTALISNDLERALGTSVVWEQRHIVADRLGVEWIAPKLDRDGNSTIGELLAIADATAQARGAIAAIRAVDPVEFPAEFAHRILGLPRTVTWLRLAARDVAAWRPPSLSADHGDQRPAAIRRSVPAKPDHAAARSIVWWLIRQTLFYPSFIVSRRHVALRIGVTVACLDAALEEDTNLSRKLRTMRYKGALAGLTEGRWWSAGIDGLAWSLPRGKAERTTALKALVAPAPLEELNLLDPVVVSNADLIETDEIAAAADCLRASDEHFPFAAPPAWVKLDEAREDRALARLVRIEDQERLEVDN